MLFFKLRRRPQSHLCRANYLVHGNKKQDQMMYARTNKIYPLLVLCLCALFSFKCRCVCHRSGGSVSIMRWEREGAKARSGLSLHVECMFKGALSRLLNMWANPDKCLEAPTQRKLEILLKEWGKKGYGPWQKSGMAGERWGENISVYNHKVGLKPFDLLCRGGILS